MKAALLLGYLGVLALVNLGAVRIPVGAVGRQGRQEVKAKKKKIIFLAGGCSHEAGEHEYYAGCKLLSDALTKAMPGKFETVVYRDIWPQQKDAFENAAAIVMYTDGNAKHPVLSHLDQVDSMMKRGVGLVCLHYAIHVPVQKGASYFLDWLGGYYESSWSANPKWEARFTQIRDHPVTNGIKPFSLTEEWYYHLRFTDNRKNIMPVLSAVPPISDKEGIPPGNKYVRSEQGKLQDVAWVTERADGGRGFGFAGGHDHQSWMDDNYRKLVLNGIIWTAKIKVPDQGVHSKTPTAAELNNNLEVKPCAVK